MPEEKYKRVVDSRMHDFGEIDFEKKRIRVNPRHGDLINTIIHEELHREFPDKSERWIRKKAKDRESKLSVAGAVKLLNMYKYGKRRRLKK